MQLGNVAILFLGHCCFQTLPSFDAMMNRFFFLIFFVFLIDGSSEEVKVEPESVKRRKTEWHAGLQKMAGDTTLCKEWWV